MCAQGLQAALERLQRQWLREAAHTGAARLVKTLSWGTTVAPGSDEAALLEAIAVHFANSLVTLSPTQAVAGARFVIVPALLERYHRYGRAHNAQRELLVFHGTNAAAVESIMNTGFAISKVGAACDKGRHGRGRYFSEGAGIPIVHKREDSNGILLCLARPGKIYRVDPNSNALYGQPCMLGFDSHSRWCKGTTCSSRSWCSSMTTLPRRCVSCCWRMCFLASPCPAAAARADVHAAELLAEAAEAAGQAEAHIAAAAPMMAGAR
jgi:hypothetical protein